jgi:hypothetical protein
MMTPAALRAMMAKTPGSGTGWVEAGPAKAAPLASKAVVARTEANSLINFSLPAVYGCGPIF